MLRLIKSKESRVKKNLIETIFMITPFSKASATPTKKAKPNALISVDLNKSADEQPFPLHSRWHPDIPPIAQVNPGDTFRIECLDCAGGQIKNSDNCNEIEHLKPFGHPLSGPIAVKGAQPGDLLVVTIKDMGPLTSWGFTCIVPNRGLLPHYFKRRAKTIWDFDGSYATSRHIPHVRFHGMMHPGVIGTAPSHKLLNEWNKREQDLRDRNPNPIEPISNPPTPFCALVGTLQGEQSERVAQEGARTGPPRENGGNGDIKNLTIGATIYLPVFVDGANLSLGDLHFSQGDGEISFCGGIEMAGWLDLHVELIKNGMQRFNLTQPVFSHAPKQLFEKYLYFTGISVTSSGIQHFLDVRLAYQQACLQTMKYLSNFGYSHEQSYMLLSAVPCEGRISSIVDIPNACVTLALPLDAFTIDINLKN